MPAISKLRVGFAGTPPFAASIVEAMIEHGFTPEVVLTQPDRRSGRGRQLQPSAVKMVAAAAGIDVRQPYSLKDDEAVAELRTYKLDILVVAAYGLLLPKTVLTTPRFGCINVHASLLPRWRGASPIQASLLEGDKQTGVTIMQMDEGLDTGGIIQTHSCALDGTETAQTLERKLSQLGATATVQTLTALSEGPVPNTPQNDSHATYAGRIKKTDGQIDFTRPAATLARQVRAYTPWPVAYTETPKERLRVLEAKVVAHSPASPGEIVRADKESLIVSCGEDALELVTVQRPGGKPVTGAQYAQGASLKTGERLVAAS